MPAAERPAAFRTDIEGLRGLAVVLVVLFHAGVRGFGGAFVAVDVFFVLSGFFLTTALAREIANEGRVNVTAFYARRLLRLLPLLLVVLVATLLSALLLYAPIDRPAVAAHLRPVAVFAGNIAFAAEGVNYFSEGENPLLHTWSLGVEQQFHLIWPPVLLLAAWWATRMQLRDRSSDDQERRRAAVRGMLWGIAIAGALSFVISVAISDASRMWAYFGPHTRLWQFALGGAAAMITGSRAGLFGNDRRTVAIAQSVGLGAIALGTVLFDRMMAYPGYAALLPALGAVLLLVPASSGPTTVIGRALSSAPLVWLGRVSYAWYLWHWPAMVLGATLVPGLGAVGRVVCGLLALVLAWLSMRFIEEPMRHGRLAAIASDRILLGATLAIAATVFVAHIAALRTQAFVDESEHRRYAAAREDRMDHRCWARSVDALPRAACAFGATSSSTRVVLLGDSHAEHWLGGLERAGQRLGWRIEANVMGGCPVADFRGMTSGASSRRFVECNRYREAMLQRIVADRPSGVLLSSYDHYVPPRGSTPGDWHVSPAAWERGLRRTYERLTGAGIPVVVLRGTPKVPFDVPSCLSRKAAAMPFSSDCAFVPDARFIADARGAQDRAARGLPVTFVDMNDRVCPTHRCTTMRDDLVVFTDDNHLTASFTRSLAPDLARRLAAAFRTLPTSPRIQDRHLNHLLTERPLRVMSRIAE